MTSLCDAVEFNVRCKEMKDLSSNQCAVGVYTQINALLYYDVLMLSNPALMLGLNPQMSGELKLNYALKHLKSTIHRLG